jgi:hypothetical protein
MNFDTFFCHLSSSRIAALIDNANDSVCYAAPGLQLLPAKALVNAVPRLGLEMLTVWVDFDERVMRMGYGDIEAVKILRDAGITVSHAPMLRSALIIVDNQGYTFTPTPLYLEAEPGHQVRNAILLSGDQVAEALVRLSPMTKAIAVALSTDPEEKIRLANLTAEGNAVSINDAQFAQVDKHLNEVPPVKFDLTRQVRVFESYLQYVELTMSGVAIQRHRLAIPPQLQKLGESKDLEGRLRTTFDLLEKGGILSSKSLEDVLNEIRKNFTRSLGKDHGRIVLKAAKPHLKQKLVEFRKMLEVHQATVKNELKKHLDDSREKIVNHYLPRVIESPPDSLLGQSISGIPSETDARQWLKQELDNVFPEAESLIQNMTLEERYKDVTFETLSHKDFLGSVKQAFPCIDWDRPYNEFNAAGEGDSEEQGK